MKCYTVMAGEAKLGIKAVEGAFTTGIRFGDDNGHVQIWPIADRWAKRLKELAIQEARLDKKEDPENRYSIRPFTNAEFESLPDNSWCLAPKPTSEEAAEALVLVLLNSGGDQKYEVTAATWVERWDERREAVVRDYMPLQDAVGVDIVHEHTSAVLFIMARGASFRIEERGTDRKVRHYIYQWRDWKWPKLERVTPPLPREDREKEAA